MSQSITVCVNNRLLIAPNFIKFDVHYFRAKSRLLDKRTTTILSICLPGPLNCRLKKNWVLNATAIPKSIVDYIPIEWKVLDWKVRLITHSLILEQTSKHI